MKFRGVLYQQKNENEVNFMLVINTAVYPMPIVDRTVGRSHCSYVAFNPLSGSVCAIVTFSWSISN